MPGSHALIGYQTAAGLAAMAAALFCPQRGQAALMVPLGSKSLPVVLQWAERQDAAVLALDSASGRVVARIASNDSLLDAIAAGIVPIKVRAPGCAESPKR